jgi:hypothetical protein
MSLSEFHKALDRAARTRTTTPAIASPRQRKSENQPLRDEATQRRVLGKAFLEFAKRNANEARGRPTLIDVATILQEQHKASLTLATENGAFVSRPNSLLKMLTRD